jgi:heme/copper-type cytochrome/quinol oxidase subunit 2
MSSKSTVSNESSKKSSIFGQRVEELSNLISGASSKAQEKEGSSIITIGVGALIIPIVIFVSLWFIQPTFVTNTETVPPEKNTKKVASWTVLFSIIIWILIYICFSYSGSFQNPSQKI